MLSEDLAQERGREMKKLQRLVDTVILRQVLILAHRSLFPRPAYLPHLYVKLKILKILTTLLSHTEFMQLPILNMERQWFTV